MVTKPSLLLRGSTVHTSSCVKLRSCGISSTCYSRNGLFLKNRASKICASQGPPVIKIALTMETLQGGRCISTYLVVDQITCVCLSTHVILDSAPEPLDMFSIPAIFWIWAHHQKYGRQRIKHPCLWHQSTLIIHHMILENKNNENSELLKMACKYRAASR